MTKDCFSCMYFKRYYILQAKKLQPKKNGECIKKSPLPNCGQYKCKSIEVMERERDIKKLVDLLLKTIQ